MREPTSPTWQHLRAAIRARFELDVADERAAGEAMRAVVVPVVQRAVEEARSAGECGRVWLFGSFAWDAPRPGSDVDLLVEGCERPFRLADRVGTACSRAVHVVELERAPASLRDRVLREGRLL